MEVHAHSHTARKKWTHYLWEFLMLFLAVFCGFLAENQREHMIEHQREKKYITSLIKDIELDIISFNHSSGVRKKYIIYYDSLVYLLKNYQDSYLNDIYFYARHAGRKTDFDYHNRTIQQLKSSGNLRLIRSNDAADSITIYDNEVINTVLDQQKTTEAPIRNDIMASYIGKIFNAYEWDEMVDDTAGISRTGHDPKLFNRNAKDLNDFLVRMIQLKTAYRITNGNIKTAIRSAENLIMLLKEEYQLE